MIANQGNVPQSTFYRVRHIFTLACFYIVNKLLFFATLKIHNVKFLDNFCRKIGVQHPFNSNSRTLTLDEYEYMHLCNTSLLCLHELPYSFVINITTSYYSFIPALIYK